jgi:hypothetical protein
MSSLVEVREGPGLTRKAKLETRLFADLLSFLLALPLGAVLLTVRYGPAIEPGGPVLGDYALPIGIGAIILISIVIRLVLTVRRQTFFLVALSFTFAAIVAASVIMGSLVHRDFFTAGFQYLLGALIAVMYRRSIWPRSSPGFNQASMRALSKAGIFASIFYVEWIMLMGYAIATRAEPRPIESLLYNVYNLAQVIALFVTSRWVERNTFHTVRLEGESLTIDGRDIVPVLGPKKTAIFGILARAPDRRLRCREIQELFRDETDEGVPERCRACTEETTKVALCAKYRNTYNSILELKRVLEFLEIGTITTPENKRRILSDGWKLALFENTRLVVRRK